MPLPKSMTPKDIALTGLSYFIKKFMDRIYYLKDRWADEKEYEDFAEYEKLVREMFKDTSFEVVSVSKAFTIKFKCKMRDVILEVKFGARGVSMLA